MSAVKLCLLLIAVLSCCEAYKILVVFPMPSKSHGNLGEGMVRYLLNEGHEITYITPYPFKSTTPKLRVIDVSSNANVIPDSMLSLEAIMNKTLRLDDQGMMMYMVVTLVKATIQNENVQKLVNDPNEKFDAVITEWMFSELPAGFAALYNCPLIWMSSMEVHWAILKLIDQPLNPAYTADSLSTRLPPFSFFQRVSELYTQLRVEFLSFTVFDKLEKEAYDELIAPLIVKQGREPPSFYDIQFNASLVLANSHVSLGQAVALPQNYIAIAGYHISEQVKPLPEDLKKIMDNAKHGVIYFSMGSNLKSQDIPKQIIDELLKMFGGLKQTVLWKFEQDLPNTPKNVHILNWAPQPSILSHPNTVLFITHGGFLSTTETVHYGVPIIGIPVFGDQFINVVRSVRRGYALKVDLSYTMVDELKLAIEEVTSNPKYAQKVKELSRLYHDRPISPGKLLAHSVKHVIDTNGAPHLRSPALNVPFYQKLYLDLLAVLLVILLIIIALLKKACRFVCRKRNVNSTKKNN